MKNQIKSIALYFTALLWGAAIGIGFAVLISTTESGLLVATAIALGITPAIAWFIVWLVVREPRRYMQLITCPECQRRCEAIIERTLPFHTYVHECEHCGYIITESEWEPL